MAEEQRDYNDRICPYCDEKTYVEAEDYALNDLEVIECDECDECGKSYKFMSEIIVEHTTTPDCSLNNEEHVYEKPFESASFRRCVKCDKHELKGGA